MNNAQRKELIETSWEIHHLVEKSYLDNLSIKGDAGWLENNVFY
jgi:hypothetical protein